MLGSIEAGRGNGNWVSERALDATARPSAIVSEIAAIDRPIRFDKNLVPTNAFSTARRPIDNTTRCPNRIAIAPQSIWISWRLYRSQEKSRGSGEESCQQHLNVT